VKLSDLIRELEAAKKQHGDLQVYTFDGPIERFDAEPSVGGFSMIDAEGKRATEIVLEIGTL